MTFDDPAAEWLERALQYFDEAVRHGVLIGEQKAFPFKIAVKPTHRPSEAEYEVSLKEGDATHQRTIRVREIGDRRNLTWDYGACEQYSLMDFGKQLKPTQF